MQNRGLAHTIRKGYAQARHIQETEATMRSIVYVGMDVHKDTVSIAILRDNNMHVEYERTLRNEPGQMKKFFKKLKEKEESILSCYEAGPTGFTLYRMLEEMEITCYVAAPTLIPRKPGDQIKTDKRDAKTLARSLSGLNSWNFNFLNRNSP